MTGYTHEMYEKRMTFDQFALSCARAFGALIEMRDDPSDAPIPEQLQPSSHHADKKHEAELEVERLSAMTGGEREAHGQKLKREQIASYQKSYDESRERFEFCNAMLGEVRQWPPPTSDHEGMKTFMVEQLETSMKFDGDDGYLAKSLREYKDKTAMQFFDESLTEARRNIVYHAKEYTEELVRTNQRNEWLSGLRKSLRRLTSGESMN